jgi:hypothetical protein
MSEFKHQLPNDVSDSFSKNGELLWRPSIALPMFVGWRLKKTKCSCGRVFKNQEDFEAHYFYHAVILNESDVQPVKWHDFGGVKK